MRFLGFVFFVSALCSANTRFDLRDALQRNTLLVISDALLEYTVGASNYLNGWIECEPKTPGPMKGEIEIDLRSIDTGLPGKDQKIREGFLASGESPYVMIQFTGTSAVKNSPVDLQIKIKNQNIVQKGTLRTQYFAASEKTALRLAGNLVKIALSFDFDLSPFVKMTDSQSAILAKKLQVRIDAVGTDAPPPSQIPVISAPKAK